MTANEPLFSKPGRHTIRIGGQAYTCDVGRVHIDGPFWGQAHNERGELVVITDTYDDVSDAWAFLIGRLHQAQR